MTTAFPSPSLGLPALLQPPDLRARTADATPGWMASSKQNMATRSGAGGGDRSSMDDNEADTGALLTSYGDTVRNDMALETEALRTQEVTVNPRSTFGAVHTPSRSCSVMPHVIRRCGGV